MKLTKENIYIDLKGKSKEELTDLYNFLESVGEKQFSSLKEFIIESVCCDYFLWGSFKQWITLSTKKENRKEVTIEELKEILNYDKKSRT